MSPLDGWVESSLLSLHVPLVPKMSTMTTYWGAWVAQSVKRLTSAQVMIAAVCGFEPHVGLHADGSEPGACFRCWVTFSLRPSSAHSLSFSQK